MRQLLVWSTVHGMAMLKLDRKLPPQVDPTCAPRNRHRTLIAGLRADVHDGVELRRLRCSLAVGLVAGFVDSIAGGGGLLALPSLLLAGLDPFRLLPPTNCRAVLARRRRPMPFGNRGCCIPVNTSLGHRPGLHRGSAGCVARGLRADQSFARSHASIAGGGGALFRCSHRNSPTTDQPASLPLDRFHLWLRTR